MAGPGAQMSSGASRICLEQNNACVSPLESLQNLGTGTFSEPLGERYRARHVEYTDPREERQRNGHVALKLEQGHPDVGGLGWRSKTGHKLKNQTYYRRPAHENLWDDPAHSGTNTWKAWHGPRLRTDAPMMERMDRLDQEKAEWDAKKTFVNTNRVVTLDRFYNRKVQRTQFERSSSWAPHHRAKREAHDLYQCFDGDLDAAPVKELKKVLTASVLQKDQKAIQWITNRLQNEETWKMTWKSMEQWRRQDTLQDFERRRVYNDMLTQMAGQPVRSHDPHHKMPNNCSNRVEELSQPKRPFVIEDITRMTDYRGLIHADNHLALEALFPGAGHDASVAIKERNTEKSSPGHRSKESLKQAISTVEGEMEQPERSASKSSVMSKSRSDGALVVSKAVVPSSKHRIKKVATRTNDEVHAKFATEQYLATIAPPVPDQKELLLTEDWSPATTKADPNRSTGDFTRTAPGAWGSHGAVSQESIPPPTRPYVYQMLAPTAERTRQETADRLARSGRSASGHKIVQRASDEAAEEQRRIFGGSRSVQFTEPHPRLLDYGDSTELQRERLPCGGGGSSSMSHGFAEPVPSTKELCNELDMFEARIAPVDPLEHADESKTCPRHRKQWLSGGSNSGTTEKPRGTGVSTWQERQEARQQRQLNGVEERNERQEQVRHHEKSMSPWRYPGFESPSAASFANTASPPRAYQDEYGDVTQMPGRR